MLRCCHFVELAVVASVYCVGLQCLRRDTRNRCSLEVQCVLKASLLRL